MLPLRILGLLWIGVVLIAGIGVGLAASWFLFLGGIFDIFTSRTLDSGIDWIDEHNRHYLIVHGGVTVGLVKIFLLEPVVVGLVGLLVSLANLPGAALLALGSRSGSDEIADFEHLALYNELHPEEEEGGEPSTPEEPSRSPLP